MASMKLLSVPVPDAVRAAIKREADADGRSMSAYVRRVVETHLKAKGIDLTASEARP